ncbi:hypothetical protein J6590_034827 [Homalodisca vitripennis]|nr:hypothetical protein J6590_034827 [Homalodisca vitripennis]
MGRSLVARLCGWWVSFLIPYSPLGLGPRCDRSVPIVDEINALPLQSFGGATRVTLRASKRLSRPLSDLPWEWTYGC